MVNGDEKEERAFQKKIKRFCKRIAEIAMDIHVFGSVSKIEEYNEIEDWI